LGELGGIPTKTKSVYLYFAGKDLTTVPDRSVTIKLNLDWDSYSWCSSPRWENIMIDPVKIIPTTLRRSLDQHIKQEIFYLEQEAMLGKWKFWDIEWVLPNWIFHNTRV
jgi:hypothetical protein